MTAYPLKHKKTPCAHSFYGLTEWLQDAARRQYLFYCLHYSASLGGTVKGVEKEDLRQRVAVLSKREECFLCIMSACN